PRVSQTNSKVSQITGGFTPDNFRFYLTHNPGAAMIEADGQEVARAEGLDQRFVSEAGEVRLTFAPRRAKVIRVRLPWVAKPIPLPGGERKRETPWLAEVRILGATGALPPSQTGTLTVMLRDALSDEVKLIARESLTAEPGVMQRLPFPLTIPASGGTRFYRIEASFVGQEASTPFLAIAPTHPLTPFKDLKPANAPDLGFIVTRGFRNVLDNGPGTQEVGAGWGQPDDLVWAYSRQLKQLGKNAKTEAGRLYLSESDMRHYSTPWRSFPNGEYFYNLAPALIVKRMKEDRRWKDSPVAILAHSDRWDTAPEVDALHGWPDFIEFDEFLRASGKPGLQGKTRKELVAEIHSQHENRWQAWHLERYVHAVKNLRDAFAAEGKRVIITAQGSPLVPAKYEAVLAEVIRGQSDDSTWGMVEESVPLTTGRQMGVMAFNPSWAMSTLLQWGFDSAVLDNPHWHNPVSCTEPSRRHLYDRAWRAVIGRDGAYHSMHTYAYNANAGFAFTMTQNDWQEYWRVQERHSLIAPEAPIGAGVVISTARFADPERAAFSGSGGWGASEADEQVRSAARTVRRLHEVGVSVPFSANVGTLDQWTNATPLVLVGVDLFSNEEIAALRKLKQRGVPLAAFTSKNCGALPKALGDLFGVNPDGSPAAGTRIGELAGKPLVAAPLTLFAATPCDELNTTQTAFLAEAMRQHLQLPLVFPPGTAGYGFTSQGMNYIVVEDWREQGRNVTVRLRASAGTVHADAVDVNDHRSLMVRRDGTDWVIDLPLRPGDGTLIAVQELAR
ncbi:MAG: hypothetical protein WCO56_24595, partial [Verrucomicrobiota bacterium]